MCAEWLIEIGHSRLKIARYRSGRMSASTAVTIEQFPDWLESNQHDGSELRPNRVWLCAVPQENVLKPVLQALHEHGMDIRRIGLGSAELPVQPAYPELGVDRWLAMQPAWEKFRSALLAIDCGTATTMDFVDAAGRHQGGWILPGRQAARHGLLAFAPGLKRLMSKIDPQPFHQPAFSTVDAIERGLILQQIGSLELILQACGQHSDRPLQLVMTGGDAEWLRAAFETVLKTNTQWLSALKLALENAWLAPDLVLQGLAMAADNLR